MNRKDGADNALRYLERAKSPKWQIEGIVYWGLFCGMIGFVLGWAIGGIV